MEDNENNEELKQLAQCLKDFLGLDRIYTNPYAILYFLADQTIKNIDQNRHFVFTSSEIANSVSKVSSEPSSWLSKPWGKINNELKQLHANRLMEFALNRGLQKYPWVTKTKSIGGASNQSLYRIIGVEIDSSTETKTNQFCDDQFDIEYVAVQDIKPSIIARVIFNTNNTAIGWRKFLLVIYPMLEMIFWVLLGIVFVLLFFVKNSTITTRDVVYMMFIYVAFLFCKRVYQRTSNFLDDRIIMASDHFLSFKENNVVQELVTVNNDHGEFLYKKVQLTKYVSKCKLCKAQVVLDRGEPDFPRRVVGRCTESPRAHVYSFDRVTRMGNRLI